MQELAAEFSPARRWGVLAKALRQVKVVYTDMDGTMLGPGASFFTRFGGGYTLRPARVLVEVLSRGVDVVLVSGRSGYQLRENVRLLGLRNYIAELGVEIGYDQGERVVIDTGELEVPGEELYRVITESGAVDFLFREYPGKLEYHTPWSRYREHTPLFRGHLDLEEVNRELDRRFPGLTMVDNGVLPFRSPTLEVHEVHAYHLLPKGVSKEKAVSRDMELRGFSPEEAVAVGDSLADLAFSDVVGAFFLVRNGFLANPGAVELVRERANVVVTEGFLNEGWAEALELSVLGGARPD
ncbi:MAG: HAD family hydrolase [Candidatus Geothermincolales bacterium]